MALRKLAPAGKAGLAFFLLGIIFFLVGFGSPYWATLDKVNTRIGLWEFCAGVFCRRTIDSGFTTFDKDGPPLWFRGTQTAACLALIALVADLVIKLLYLGGMPKKFLLISVGLDVLTGALAFVAAGVFSSEVKKYALISLNWSFAFVIVGGIFFIGSAIGFLVQYSRN